MDLGDIKMYTSFKDISISEETIVEEISNKLEEENKELIYKIVKLIGIENTIKYYEETKRIEESGGLFCDNGRRRKRPGGVFFYLVNHNEAGLNKDLKNIFVQEARKKDKLCKKQREEERKRLNEEIRQQLIREGLLNLKDQRTNA